MLFGGARCRELVHCRGVAVVFTVTVTVSGGAGGSHWGSDHQPLLSFVLLTQVSFLMHALNPHRSSSRRSPLRRGPRLMLSLAHAPTEALCGFFLI
jgi:hypothetical protein